MLEALAAGTTGMTGLRLRSGEVTAAARIKERETLAEHATLARAPSAGTGDAKR